MFRKYFLPALAVIGFLYAVYSVKNTNEAPPVAPPPVAPSASPFSTFIFGAGIIEANTENIVIGAPVAGIVTAVPVKVGARVRAGDPLVLLDDRELRAALAVRKARLAATWARRDRLFALPRPEEVTIAQAKRAEAAAHAAEMETQRARAAGVSDLGTVSAEEMDRRTSAAAMAQAKLSQAEADLALLRSGAWTPDRDLAHLEVAAAEAEGAEIQTAIERLTVRAPSDGEVLQVNVRVGERATTGERGLILLGHTHPLAVRVDIDEYDAWRFQSGTEAVAFVRGNPQIKMPLTFSHLEPMLTPKRSLTGESTERVDTRVLQAIYHFDRGTRPVYIGQQVDVYIATPNSPDGHAETQQRGEETGEKP
jgi:multidrug efflux pump subunit AcrA (membrane-fusion protein)